MKVTRFDELFVNIRKLRVTNIVSTQATEKVNITYDPSGNRVRKNSAVRGEYFYDTSENVTAEGSTIPSACNKPPLNG